MICAVRNSENCDERISEEWPQSVVHEPSSQHTRHADNTWEPQSKRKKGVERMRVNKEKLASTSVTAW